MSGPAGGGSWSVGVVIPARNEAMRVERSIRSVLRALDRARAGPAAVVIVADACSDDTAERARRALGRRGVVLERRFASVGKARRAGARALGWWAQLRGETPSRVWLANTDADSQVPEIWVRAQLDLADRGAAAVAGTVDLGADEDACPALVDRFRCSYARGVESAHAHAHVHGANLGVRGDAYRDVGGWPRLDTGEDRRLWFRLRARGWPTVSTVEAAVSTSPRRRGRARAGLADDLRALSREIG